MDPAIAANGEYGAGTVMLALVFTVLMVVACWKIFTKAGEPGWASIVPIYNIFVWLRIAGKPGWWILLLFVPLVNFVVSILVTVGLAKAFGKGAGFVVGLIFLPFIFYLILAFGSDEYRNPATI